MAATSPRFKVEAAYVVRDSETGRLWPSFWTDLDAAQQAARQANEGSLVFVNRGANAP